MNNKGVALLTVLLVMIIGLGLTAITTLLVVRGYQTSRTAKNYQIALQMAQGGIEEAIIKLETTWHYNSLQNFKNYNPQTGDLVDPNDFYKYEINEVFRKDLAGFGGAPVFPPASAASGGNFTTGVYYLIHSRATKGDSQADLYVLYVKGY